MRYPLRKTIPQHQPSADLAVFLAETLNHVRAGQIGRETARDAIKAWPAIYPADHTAKARAIRELACICPAKAEGM